MSQRVYLPVTLADLAAYVAAGALPEEVERFVADPAEGESEEAEYAALMAAADASTALLTGPGRRVVVVAEVGDADAAVPLERVVAVHADTEDRGPDADPDDDLAWFASQEIDQLL